VRIGAQALDATETPALGPAQVFIHPHRVLVGAEGPLPARVTTRTYEGATALLGLETPFGALQAEVAATHPVRPGDAVGVTLPAEALRVFPA
jgi:hypothetical protein